jgi:hypothetical protein
MVHHTTREEAANVRYPRNRRRRIAEARSALECLSEGQRVSQQQKMKVEDYKPLAALVKGYELKPDHSYLFVCDGKKFSYELANALLKNVRDNHPNIGVFIIATPKSKGIEVREKDGV